MKIFIDTANLDEIKEAFSWGIIDGVTTNPSLIKKAVDFLKQRQEDINMESYIEKILETVRPYPVSLEVISTKEEEMYKEAVYLYERFNPIANNVAIKIPVNPAVENSETKFDGLKVINKLSKKTIPVNCTLIMTPEQALLAAKSGAAYVSPFAGRIDDYLRKRQGVEFEKSDYYPEQEIDDNGIVSGVDLVRKIVKILKIYNMKTEVIVASTRNPRQVREIALTGAHIATIPFDVLEKMIYHEKTKEGVQKFKEDIVSEYKKIFE